MNLSVNFVTVNLKVFLCIKLYTINEKKNVKNLTWKNAPVSYMLNKWYCILFHVIAHMKTRLILL